ncbi:MAG: SH3 domain-containing protein [Lachnospiraceae bacterium]|nr:SH3 domain-containing protein [Lachnospiraceae bacterium]
MKKRLYLALLVTLTTAFVLTGCSAETGEETTENITSEEVMEETETSEVEETTEDVAEPTTEETTETETSEEVVEETETSEVEETTEDVAEPTTEETTETDTSEEIAETPAYTVTDMEKTMYAQRSVNVRTGPTTDYEKLGALNTNDEIKVTGQSDNGWYRIEYNGNTGFVSNNYLGDAKVVVNNTPATPTTPTTPSVDTSNAPTRTVNGDTRYAFRTTANGTPIYDGIDWQWPQYIVDVINECCTPGMSDMEKATALYNWMITNVGYDTSYKSTTTNSTLNSRVATCQGYANAYQSLCCASGISTSVISGYTLVETGANPNHAWDYVYIDSVRYFVDTTNRISPTSALVFYTDENGRNIIEITFSDGNKGNLGIKGEYWDGIHDSL